MKTNTDHLPKFLIADDGSNDDEARDFVVHLHYPRFVMEIVENECRPVFIDDEKLFIDLTLKEGKEPAMILARLMREAGDFYRECLDR
jgi:hypothetical protein